MLVKTFVFKKISTIEIPKSSKLHRYVNKVRKLYHARYKCNNKRDPKQFSVSHMTNYVNFKLSKDVEKNPGPTQYNTDHQEVIIRPFMQNHSSTMQLTSPISSENLMQSRLGELGLQSIDVGGAGDCFFRSVSHQLYGNSNHHMCIRTAGGDRVFCL